MESVTAINSMGTWQETVLVHPPQARMLLKPVDAPLLGVLLLLVLLLLSRISSLMNLQKSSWKTC